MATQKNASEAILTSTVLVENFKLVATENPDNKYYQKVLENANEPPNNEVSALVQEYLRQIGKRIQLYWGTAYPKHFIRTFGEVRQLLKHPNSEGLSIVIRDEDNLQKVRLEIIPYVRDDKKPVTEAELLKTFIIPKGLLKKIDPSKSQSNKVDPNTLSINQPLGIEFCVGKETTDAELYDYYIIMQIVDLCHNRIVNGDWLPIAIPGIHGFENYQQ